MISNSSMLIIKRSAGQVSEMFAMQLLCHLTHIKEKVKYYLHTPNYHNVR